MEGHLVKKMWLAEEEQTIDFLQHKIEIWNFSKLLKKFYIGEESLQERLIRKLSEYDGEKEENKKNAEQTARKVRNWLNGCNQPANREELFKICFAMGLSESDADELLLSADEEGIHYRNPKELVYAFFLRMGYDYPKAEELLRKLGQEGLITGRVERQKLVRRSSEWEPVDCLTVSIRDDFRNVRDVEELENFLHTHQAALGVHHNTAYQKFKVMLEYLLECETEKNSADMPEEKKYSIERVAEEYLRMGIPYERKNGSQTKLMKQIKKYWPSPKMVQEMYSRKRDVNRKTLLILYLATEGMGVEAGGENFLAEHCWRMNLMLSSCAMTLLNVHNPFDYLVIQSLNLENEEDFMSWKMERMLYRLFRKNENAAYIEIKNTKKTAGREL